VTARSSHGEIFIHNGYHLQCRNLGQMSEKHQFGHLYPNPCKCSVSNSCSLLSSASHTTFSKTAIYPVIFCAAPASASHCDRCISCFSFRPSGLFYNPGQSYNNNNGIKCTPCTELKINERHNYRSGTRSSGAYFVFARKIKSSHLRPRVGLNSCSNCV